MDCLQTSLQLKLPKHSFSDCLTLTMTRLTNLRLLEVFLTVIDRGSMVDAAAALDCTTPAVSQQITALERAYGARLLVRSHAGTTPTDVGLVLERHARRLFGVAAEMDDAIERALDPEQGMIRITAFGSASAVLLPRAVADFRKRYPRVRVSLVDSDWTKPFQALLDHEADMTLIPEFDFVPLQVPGGIVCTPVGRDPFRLVIPMNSPLAKRKVVDLRTLEPMEWVYYASRFPHTSTLVKAAAEAGFVPRITSEVSDYQVLPGLVAAGLGISLATSLMLAGSMAEGATWRPLRGPSIGRSVHLATRDDIDSRHAQDMHSSLVAVFEEICSRF